MDGVYRVACADTGDGMNGNFMKPATFMESTSPLSPPGPLSPQSINYFSYFFGFA